MHPMSPAARFLFALAEANDGNYPCTCTSEAFNPSVLSPIQGDMTQYWPSLNGASDTVSGAGSKQGPP